MIQPWARSPRQASIIREDFQQLLVPYIIEFLSPVKTRTKARLLQQVFSRGSGSGSACESWLCIACSSEDLAVTIVCSHSWISVYSSRSSLRCSGRVMLAFVTFRKRASCRTTTSISCLPLKLRSLFSSQLQFSLLLG